MSDREAVNESDAELLRRSAQGDSAAFEAFVGRHEAWLYRYARSLSREAADQVLQDAFVDAWRGAKSFHGADAARAWLTTIARNAFRRRFRRLIGEPLAHEPMEAVDQIAVAAGWGADTSSELDRLITREAVERALAELAPIEREAVVLRDVEGFSADEAAAILGVSRAAIKSRLHRGRLRLAALLREFDHGRP